MSRCVMISSIVMLTYVVTTKSKGRYIALFQLIHNVANLLLGIALIFEQHNVVIGVFIVFASIILIGLYLNLLLSQNQKKTEHK